MNNINQKLLFLFPKRLKVGQPSSQRINAFINFYKRQNVDVCIYDSPVSVKEKINLIIYIYKHKIKYVFVSMPPFRNWYLFILLRIKLILDIRDGWSIAIRTGYGSTVLPKAIKAKLSQVVEFLAIKRSILTITCTTGLQEYLQNISLRDILLITNGVSTDDLKLIKAIIKNKGDDEINYAVCIGQFSEYGKDKVINVLRKIGSQKTIVKLIGASPDRNIWINTWLKDNEINNIEIRIIPWLERSEMYYEVVNADYGIVVIRNPAYEFGTKIFDYIACNLPVLNYFDHNNEFVIFFKDYFTDSYNSRHKIIFIREDILESHKENLMKIFY